MYEAPARGDPLFREPPSILSREPLSSFNRMFQAGVEYPEGMRFISDESVFQGVDKFTIKVKTGHAVELNPREMPPSPHTMFCLCAVSTLTVAANATTTEMRKHARRGLALAALGRLTVGLFLKLLWSPHVLSWVLAHVTSTRFRTWFADNNFTNISTQRGKRLGNVFQHLRLISPYVPGVIAHLAAHADVSLALPRGAVKIFTAGADGKGAAVEMSDDMLRAWVEDKPHDKPAQRPAAKPRRDEMPDIA